MLDKKLQLKAKTVGDLQKLAGAGKLSGWVRDLPMEVYHAGPGIGSHGLIDVLRSPARYRAKRARPTEPTEAMVIGSAVHCAVLEPEKFDSLYCVKPLGTDRRTKAGKEAYESWAAANVGKTEIRHDQDELVKAIAERCRRHSKFAKMLEGGVAELTCYAPFFNGHCRIRPDLYIPSTGVVVDLKTTQDARPEEFSRTVANALYHVQAAFYLDVLKTVGLKAEHFIFAAVEKEPPFDMGLYYLSPRTREVGITLYQRALAIWDTCMREDNWPGLPEDIKAIEAPDWYLKQAETNYGKEF